MTELDELIMTRANIQDSNYIPIIASNWIDWLPAPKVGYLCPKEFLRRTGVHLRETFYIRSADTEKVTMWRRSAITPSVWRFIYEPRKYDDVDDTLHNWHIEVKWT